MSLSTISMDQALDIWSELEQALAGKNGYGGVVAEIYVYRLMPYSPRMLDSIPDEVHSANTALYELLTKFSRDRDAEIWILAGRKRHRVLGEWLRTCGQRHRHHIEIRPRES